jgi:uncharacterized protein YbjT (DUF2867 family)
MGRIDVGDPAPDLPLCTHTGEQLSLLAALDGVQTAFYLVHNMGSGHDFEEKDRHAAANFAAAAQACGVRRIIYLGGLGDSSPQLSAYLRSRQEVGEEPRFRYLATYRT